VETCARGINFKPDADFQQTLAHYQRIPKYVDIVMAMTPKSIVDPPPARVQAYNAIDNNPALLDHAPHVPDADLFARALELAPDSGPLNLAVARFEMAKKNYVAAEAHLHKAIELWPQSAEAHHALATIDILQKKPADAVAAAREAVRLAPDSIESQMALGTALVSTGQYKDAIEPLRAVQSVGQRTPIVYRLYALSLLHAGQFADAIPPLQSYLATNNNDAFTHYFLGVAYRGIGKKPEAIEQFDKAGLLAPTNPLFALVRDEMSAAPGASSGAPMAEQVKVRNGEVSANIYTNRYFGFTFTIPGGWHVLTGEACTKLTADVFALPPAMASDPIARDSTELAASVSTPVLCASPDDAHELKPGATLIRVTAINTSTSMQPMLAESTVRGVATHLTAVNRKNGAGDVPPEQVTIDGKTFWKVQSPPTQPGAATLRVLLAATDLNGYALTFDLEANDPTTLATLATALESIKFTAAAGAAPPSN
jgi:tetratricopeptide (TPR) repeat protein